MEQERWEVPNPSGRYVIGIDPAAGVGGDDSALVVLNRTTNNLVFRFHANALQPDEFGQQALRILRYYDQEHENVVEANIETNHASYVAILEILREQGGFYRWYQQEVWDAKRKTFRKNVGFRTHRASRDVLIDDARTIVRNGTIKIRDAKLIEQMMNFKIIDEKAQAMMGYKDDILFAFMLALQSYKQVPLAETMESYQSVELEGGW